MPRIYRRVSLAGRLLQGRGGGGGGGSNRAFFEFEGPSLLRRRWSLSYLYGSEGMLPQRKFIFRCWNMHFVPILTCFSGSNALTSSKSNKRVAYQVGFDGFYRCEMILSFPLSSAQLMQRQEFSVHSTRSLNFLMHALLANTENITDHSSGFFPLFAAFSASAVPAW